jgi:hypothetical protein
MSSVLTPWAEFAESPIAVSSVAAVLVLIVANLLRRYQHGKKYRLPVRVPGIPIFGNSFQLPPTQQGPWAKEKAEQYGEM